MANLAKARASAGNQGFGMTASTPVCDCPEPCACYAEGYDQNEALVSSPGDAETTPRKTPEVGLHARRPAQEDFLHAYIDESGNTGFNLFDPAQPFFQNVAMSSLVDFDEVFQNRVQRMADRLGVAYLHGNELGVDGVEQIAGDIAELIEFSQVKFYFAAINKRDVAAIKFYDAIFDPGENPRHPLWVTEPERRSLSCFSNSYSYWMKGTSGCFGTQ